MHPPLKVRKGPVPGRLAFEKELDDVGFRLSYPTGGDTLFQVEAGFLVSFPIRHLGPLRRLLENDHELDRFIANRLKFLVNHAKGAAGRKQCFLLVEIRRQPPY